MSVADEIRKLADLRDEGLITESEFSSQKAALLNTADQRITAQPDEQSQLTPIGSSTAFRNWQSVPLVKRWWFQALTTLLMVPIGLILMLAQKAYFKKQDGSVEKRSGFMKLIFATLAIGLWGYSFLVLANEEGRGFDPEHQLASCNSNAARLALVDAIENNAASNLQTLRLLDLSNIETVDFNGTTMVRRCNATFVLNSGTQRLGYELSMSANNFLLVEVLEPFDLSDVNATQNTTQENSNEDILVKSNPLDIARAAVDLYVEEMFYMANCCEAEIVEGVRISSTYKCDSEDFFPAYEFKLGVGGKESYSVDTVGICVPKPFTSLADVVVIEEQLKDVLGEVRRRDLSEEYNNRLDRGD